MQITACSLFKLKNAAYIEYCSDASLESTLSFEDWCHQRRLNLFARTQRPYDGIPSTKAALKEHAKCAAYQAGIIWGQATLPQPDVGTLANYRDGCKKEKHGRFAGQPCCWQVC